MKRSSSAFVFALIVFAADQITKFLALEQLRYGQPVEIIQGFFSLTLIYNTGAAWGTFKAHGPWLTCLSVAALIFLVKTHRHFTALGALPTTALGLLVGGISGNLADRLSHGHVVDFLDFYIGFSWPAFNLADSAICCGVGLYVLDSLRRERQDGHSSGVSSKAGQGLQD